MHLYFLAVPFLHKPEPGSIKFSFRLVELALGSDIIITKYRKIYFYVGLGLWSKMFYVQTCSQAI